MVAAAAGPVLLAAGRRASASVTNGRGRATACLMVLQTRESPGQTINSSMSRQSRPRAPPFPSSSAAATSTAGKKNLFPLANGITTSKTGLLNVWLMKWNSPESNA